VAGTQEIRTHDDLLLSVLMGDHDGLGPFDPPNEIALFLFDAFDHLLLL
jgi:hypothetical protein